MPERTLLEKRGRVEEILRVLSHYGLLFDALDAGPEWLRAIHLPKPDPTLARAPLPDRLSNASCELGPTFVKIGQILGTRPDIVGPVAAEALSSLQADVPAEHFSQIRMQVESELGKPMSEAFASFDPDPVGAASVGQVHAATLPDGSPVVVKVLRPGIEAVVSDDLEVLSALAQIASKSPSVAPYRPVQIMDELAHALNQELDLRREAANLNRFRQNFAGQSDVVFPQPIAGLCTQRVLTETRISGTPLSRSMAELSDEQKHSFVELGVGVYLDMVFRDNLFHGDPHAGNLFYAPTDGHAPTDGQGQTDGQGPTDGHGPTPTSPQLGIIDFGEVGRLDPAVLDKFEVLILSLVSQDSERLVDTLLELVDAPADLDRGAFRRDVNDWVDDFIGMSSPGSDMSGTIVAGMAILRNHNLMLPPDLALLIKALLQLQGLLVSTGLKVKLFDYIAPYSRRIMRQRLAPRRLARTVAGTARDWTRFLEHTPADIEGIVASVKQGELQLPLDVKGLDKPVNRIVAGMLLASMLRGSSQLWSNRAEPVVAGISIPGALGTTVSLIGTLRLLRALRRSGGV